MNTKLFGTGSPPRYLPISPRLPELSSPGALSICAKFIRLPSVCVAIMAAPSCCSSKSAYRVLKGLALAMQQRSECSQLLTWLWLTAPIMKRPVSPLPHPISVSTISTPFIMSVCLLKPNFLNETLKLDKMKSQSVHFSPLIYSNSKQRKLRVRVQSRWLMFNITDRQCTFSGISCRRLK